MPRPDDKTRLRHILESPRKAVRFASRRNSGDAAGKEVLLLAIIRLLEVIGEAAAGVSDGFKARHPEIPWRQMSAMRNRLVHGYFEVDPGLVWQTVAAELPVLVRQIEAATGTSAPDGPTDSQEQLR